MILAALAYVYIAGLFLAALFVSEVRGTRVRIALFVLFWPLIVPPICLWAVLSEVLS